jgi:hypothetical protein
VEKKPTKYVDLVQFCTKRSSSRNHRQQSLTHPLRNVAFEAVNDINNNLFIVPMDN